MTADNTRDLRQSMKRCPECGQRNIVATDGTYLTHGPGRLGEIVCRMSGRKVEAGR